MVVNNVINLPSMTGNGTTYKNGDDWGMVQMALFYPHYRRDFNPKNWDLTNKDRVETC